jgi:uncharacterized integral membrane protein (TIGR00698 family)
MLLIKDRFQGVFLCFVLALPAYFLGKEFEIIGGPVFAILLGMLLSKFVREKDILKSGITFTSKKVLQYAVILLGFGLNLSTVIAVGATSLPIIISTIATSLITAYIIFKLINIPAKSSILIGVGSSICGGSAIAATAPVIDANHKEIAQAISVIFLFNIIAALIFPTLGNFLGLSDHGFAIFAGTAVNDTSSVTAAASSWDSMHNTGTEVLTGATIVKLTRTLAIIPITLVLGFYQAKKASGQNKASIKSAFPMFILYFIIASIITTFLNYFMDRNIFSAEISSAILSFFALMKFCSKYFIIMAMGAIGLHTDIVDLIKNGGRPIIMGFCCWVAIACVSLFVQHLLGLW